MKQIITVGALLSVIMLGLLGAPAQQASPRLIPFQGRLTDQQGRAYTNGQYTLIFTLYSQAVGGTALNGWVERHRKVGVINGMVNVFLGSIRPLDPVDFSQVVHLGITIDADDNETTADPEMVPRQMIIPAFWAKQADNSTKLANSDWSSILVSGNDPVNGKILASKIQPLAITAAQIANNTITANQIASSTITSSQIATGGVSRVNLDPTLIRDGIIPPGVIQAFGGANSPDGWILCDGRAVSRAEYQPLFLAIGTNFGSGDGITTFNVPNGQALVLRGTGAITVNSRQKSGPTLGTVQEDSFQDHWHTATGLSLPATSPHTRAGGPITSGNADTYVFNDLGTPFTPAYLPTTGSGGAPRANSETRVSSLGVNFIIKH